MNHPQLAGYRVYRGNAAGSYSQNTDVGLVTETTVSGLADCTTHYVAVKAYTSTGAQSTEFSNVVSGWPRPRITSVSPTALQQGSQATLTVNGSNFQPGATVTFADSTLVVTGVTVSACNQLLVNVAVGAGAALGPRNVEVVNADHVFGAGTGLFSVTADSSGPVISEVHAGAVGATSTTITWTTQESSTSQVFFRLSGQTNYQATPIDSALDTDHAVTLHGLRPGSVYHFYVRSVDAAGNASASTPTQSFTTLASSFTYIRFEAEAGAMSSPITTYAGSGLFQGKCIGTPSGAAAGSLNNPNGVASYGFYVPDSGNWTVWLRMYGASTSSDGWLEAVDGAVFEYAWPPSPGTWQWSEAGSYSLGVGLHTLRLGGLDAGARIDRIVVTDDPNFIPSEQPGADVSPPGPAANLSATATNSSVALAWTNPSNTDLATIVIRYRTDGSYPVSPVDGLPLVNAPGTPNGPGNYQHTGLIQGTTYHYSVFAIDTSENASDRVTVQATAAVAGPIQVQNVRRTDTR